MQVQFPQREDDCTRSPTPTRLPSRQATMKTITKAARFSRAAVRPPRFFPMGAGASVQLPIAGKNQVLPLPGVRYLAGPEVARRRNLRHLRAFLPSPGRAERYPVETIKPTFEQGAHAQLVRRWLCYCCSNTICNFR
ncbi:unnamed protein product [Amoebophrya sp. A120]|nr:unnamed protein product [Amoebophrya sp. A120]|eukprot:GSA120T00020321001.1